MLYYAHSGLRYLVLLVALGALGALGYSLRTGRAHRTAYMLHATFAGLLDLELLLGMILVIGGMMPDAVVGHLVLMVIAAVVTHASGIIGKRSSSDRRELVIRLCGVALALLLVVAGIMALDRGILAITPPPKR